jgi:hypothetical protein
MTAVFSVTALSVVSAAVEPMTDTFIGYSPSSPDQKSTTLMPDFSRPPSPQSPNSPSHPDNLPRPGDAEYEEYWARERLFCGGCEVFHNVSKSEDPDVCDRERFGPHFQEIRASIEARKLAELKRQRQAVASDLLDETADKAKELVGLMDVILRSVDRLGASGTLKTGEELGLVDSIRLAASQARRVIGQPM